MSEAVSSNFHRIAELLRDDGMRRIAPGTHDGGMSDATEADESEADLREHLRRIDEEIKAFRQELDTLREDPRDWEDWEERAISTRATTFVGSCAGR